MKQVLICGTKEETGSQVSRDGQQPRHVELHCTGRRGTRTLGQDLLYGVVVLLSVVILRMGLMGCVVQRLMLITDVRPPGTELTLMPLPELSGSHSDAVGVLTNPAHHLSGCEPGLGAVSAHRSGSQYPQRVTHPELPSCGLQGGPGSHGMLVLKLLANFLRRNLLQRKELLGIRCHAFTGQVKSRTQGGP